METIREVFDHYLPLLIMKMKDPQPAIRFCERYNTPHTKMVDLTKKVPDEKIRELFDMVNHSYFSDNPNFLYFEMNTKLKELKEQDK